MHSFEVHSNERACRKSGSLRLEQVWSKNTETTPIFTTQDSLHHGVPCAYIGSFLQGGHVIYQVR